MDILITKAMPEDAEELLALLRKIGSETDNLSFGAEGLPFSVEQERAFIKSLMESTSSVMLLAKKDGRIVGDASFTGNTRERVKHRGEIGISVLREEWGQGIGRQLMEATIDFAKNTAHAEIISLEVRSDNIRAIRLYEKFGFEKIGTFKGFLKVDGKMIDFDLMNLYL